MLSAWTWLMWNYFLSIYFMTLCSMSINWLSCNVLDNLSFYDLRLLSLTLFNGNKLGIPDNTNIYKPCFRG